MWIKKLKNKIFKYLKINKVKNKNFYKKWTLSPFLRFFALKKKKNIVDNFFIVGKNKKK